MKGDINIRNTLLLDSDESDADKRMITKGRWLVDERKQKYYYSSTVMH